MQPGRFLMVCPMTVSCGAAVDSCKRVPPLAVILRVLSKPVPSGATCCSRDLRESGWAQVRRLCRFLTRWR